MANQSKLKAWVRYDGTGRVISGGPIFQVNKPKVGNWKQIDANLCCNSTLTTTTTQGGGGVTPTAWVSVIATTGFTTAWDACNGIGSTVLVYTSVPTITPGTYLYSDATLTTLIPYNFGSIAIQGIVYDIVNGGQINPLSVGQSCSGITTTTSTTTQAPVFTVENQRWGNTSSDACNNVNPLTTFYTTGPLEYGNYFQNGNVIYLDQALTQPVTYPFIVSPGISRLLDCTNGVLSNQRSCFDPTTTTTTTEAPVYTIGQAALGGIIAYIDGGGSTGTSGLVATAADISTGAEWGCIGTEIAGADGTAIGTGNQNTIDIMAGCATAGIAARLCGDLTEGGYSDWYLPSKDELNQLYINRVAIGGFSSENQYWSSTENGANFAWKQNFSNSAPGFTGKVNPFYVRAIRSF